MVSARVQPVDCAVQLVGQPCQWVPVPRVGSRYVPNQTLQGQSILYMGIIKDVHVVIEVNEFIMLNGPIDEKRQKDERQTDQEL
jgi:hypothetical protein